MSGLAVRNKSGEKVNYTGSQFDGLESVGSHHLCVRTGSGEAGVKKYALTSTPLNDKYKALKMRIPDNAGANAGEDAYIAQRYYEEKSTTQSYLYVDSRESNYTETNTITQESTTRSKSATTSTRNSVVTRYGNYVNRSSSTSGSGTLRVTRPLFSQTRTDGVAVIMASSATSSTNVTRTVTHTSSARGIDGAATSYWGSTVSFPFPCYVITRNATTSKLTTVSVKETVQSTTMEMTKSSTRSSTYWQSGIEETTTSVIANNVNL